MDPAPGDPVTDPSRAPIAPDTVPTVAAGFVDASYGLFESNTVSADADSVPSLAIVRFAPTLTPPREFADAMSRLIALLASIVMPVPPD